MHLLHARNTGGRQLVAALDASWRSAVIAIRRSGERGHFDHGWLDTYHSFSFAGYYDSRYMGFRSLRVLNEDKIHPGRGFLPHDHKDMEIVTVVLAGALEHKDSMGNGSVIRPGEVQRMSAGTGVTHSEFNSSTKEPVHLLQIWVFPERKHLTPGYEQKSFPLEERKGRLQLLASPDGSEDSVTIHQNVRLYMASLAQGERLVKPLVEDRHGWLQVISGEVGLNGSRLEAGDGVGISQERSLELRAIENSEFILFDLA